jgi:hypothetical protein
MEQKMEKIGGESAEACTATSGFAGEREKRKITVERNQIRISAVQREHYWQRRRMEQKMEKIGGESAEACTATSGLGKYCADGWPL